MSKFQQSDMASDKLDVETNVKNTNVLNLKGIFMIDESVIYFN